MHSRADILQKVQQHPFGLSEERLLDAYHGVQDDIQHLVQNGQILHLSSSTASSSSSSSQPPRPRSPSASSNPSPTPPAPATSTASLRKDAYSILFPRHRQWEVAMDPALVSAWRAVVVPYNPADLDDVLLSAGLMSERQMKAAHLAKSALAKLEIKKRKKDSAAGKRKRYRQHLTNTHLLQQDGYQWLKQSGGAGAPATAPAPAAGKK